MAKSAKWQQAAVAAAVAAVMGLGSASAWALSLGRLTVLSAPGESLRAEIDVADISTDEAASLRVNMAPAVAFQAAGLELDPSLDGVRITLEKRPNGRPFLLLQGGRPVSASFVDLILEASWSAGRIVRDYTVLFSPPPAATPAVQIPVPAQIAPLPTAPLPAIEAAPAPVPPPPAAPEPVTATPAPTPTPSSSTAKSPAPSTTRSIKVQAGDTAGRLAATHRPEGVSLDQMLVAMLRANPEAFVNGNINRLKAGTVLNLPDTEQANQTDAEQARQIVRAQSRDFNEYRRKLSAVAPRAPADSPAREAAGRIETRVEEKKPGTEASDRLTLSKGAISAPTQEDELSKRNNEKEAAARAQELSKNISELSKLSSEVAGTAVAPASEASGALVAPVALPAASAAASEPAAPASAPATSAPAPQASVASGGSPLNDVIEHPLMPAVAGSLVAALLALALYRIRKRRNEEDEPLNSAVLDEIASPPEEEEEPLLSETQPDEPTPEPMAETPRETDPVAEADVYLAYGRDDQAEEILVRALETEPERMAIHLKLLDIHAQRLDRAAFEARARAVQLLTDGQGEDWQRVCALGMGIDPDNSLYQSIAEPAPDASPLPDETSIASEPPAEEMAAATTPADEPPVFALPDNEPEPEPEANLAELSVPPAPASGPAPMEFDLSSISLDLETPPPATGGDADNPLAVKLALAEEFIAIGDTDGARSLLEEIMAESEGEIKTQAEQALRKLG